MVTVCLVSPCNTALIFPTGFPTGCVVCHANRTTGHCIFWDVKAEGQSSASRKTNVIVPLAVPLCELGQPACVLEGVAAAGNAQETEARWRYK